MGAAASRSPGEQVTVTAKAALPDVVVWLEKGSLSQVRLIL